MNGLSKDLLNRVIHRLGFSELPVADLTNLRNLYASWCMNVPFDNVRKMIVPRSEEKRPLSELLSSLGYHTSRLAGFMRDPGIINHGSAKVSINGMDYLVDASLLLNVILPPDQSTYIHNDAIFQVESARKPPSQR